MAAKTSDKPAAAQKPGKTKSAGDPRKCAVRVRAGVLRAALKDVAVLVSGRATLPILDHVLFFAGDGRIVVTASDLDIWATRDCASDDRDGPGSADWVKSIRPFSITLPAKPLLALLGELDSEAMVTITAPDNLTETYSGQVVLAAGRARFKLYCLPPADFPNIPRFSSAASFELPCAALLDAFHSVEHAISSDEIRYYINGIYIHPHQDEGEAQQLRLAATDGSRLARLVLNPPEGAASFPTAIIHRATISLLNRLLAAAIKVDDGAVVLVESAGELPDNLIRYSLPATDDGAVVVLAKTVDGTFPDYDRVIPARPEHIAIITREALAEAVKRVGVLSSHETRSVKAVFSTGKLELVVAGPELGEAREELAVVYDGPEVAIGLNGQYWCDALKALATDDVTMGFTDPLAAVLLRASATDGDPARLVQVLMPLRVA